jgi:glycosyltransferase involved in cell wall biosynthesis
LRDTRPSVAIVHYTAPPIVGGVEAVMAEHARLLVEAGYPVTVVVGRGGSGLPEGVTVHVVPEMDSEAPDNLALAPALERGQLPPQFSALQARIEHGLRAALGTADLVIPHNVLTTHFNLPLTSALHALLDQRRLPPAIAWCHDISRHVNPSSGFAQRSGPAWDLLRTARPQVTYVAVSDQRRQALAQVLGCARDRIQVIPNGVNPDLLLGLSEVGRSLVEAFELLDCDLILLMPIRVTRAKNIEFAIQVTAALKDSGLRVRLVVSGPPDPHAPDIEEYLRQLRDLRHRLGVAAQVRFIYEGFPGHPGPMTIGDKIVGELYRIADLVLLPSHREGFGMPVLEAGMADKPVFTTRIPAVEALGPERLHLIERDESPAQVARRVIAWADQDSAHRLRRRVRQSYTWPKIFNTQIQPLITMLAAPAAGRVS